jgi:predicted secreted protein
MNLFCDTRVYLYKLNGGIILKKILFLLLLAMMTIFPGMASASLSADDFTDVSGHWAEQQIAAAASLGFMTGMGTDSQGLRVFAPDGIVSRAQLASVLQRSFQLDYGQIRFIKQPLASDYYRDVDNEAWYADSLVMCAVNKIFDTGGDFSPQRPVSRIEIAQAVYRSFNAKGISVPMIMMMPVYADTQSLSLEEMNAVVFVSNTGIMRGSNNYFCPESNLTRAELAQVLMRCISLMAVNEADDGGDFQVPAGQLFTAALKSNPSTGYAWMIKSVSDENIIKPTANTYLSEGSGEQPLVGQGGSEYWQFQALQAGTTLLQMVYARPWESVQPAQTFTLQVTVTS